MMKINKVKSVLVMVTIMLTNCRTIQAQESRPALLEYSSPEIRSVLEQAIGSLMNSQPIKLADNVFTQNSTVIVERDQLSNNRSILLDDRNINPADTFSLLIKNSQCFLQHNQSGNIKVMSLLSCKPL
jgi:hypothetical protein